MLIDSSQMTVIPFLLHIYKIFFTVYFPNTNPVVRSGFDNTKRVIFIFLFSSILLSYEILIFNIFLFKPSMHSYILLFIESGNTTTSPTFVKPNIKYAYIVWKDPNKCIFYYRKLKF